MRCFILNELNHTMNMIILTVYNKEHKIRSKAMIRYYFGDDEGLSFDYEELSEEYYNKLKQFIK